MNQPRPSESIHYHLIPDDHKCSECKKGKGVVGFSLSKGKVKPRCNTCEGKSKKRRLIEKMSVSGGRLKNKKVIIREKIANYFKENYEK